MNSHRNGNSSDTDSSVRRFSQSTIYIIVLTFSTFIFVSSMILTVYLTHTDSLDKALVVLIVASCLLFIFGFLGIMYSIYHSKPNGMSSASSENLNQSSRILAALTPNTSNNQRPPDIVRVSRAREFLRKTPPPPYEVQMSEMSRMLLPGSSQMTESSDREAEIAEEARRLIQRLYEEIRRTDQLAQQSSIDAQPVQQVVEMPKTLTQQGMTSPKVLHPNLVVQKQQTVVKSSPNRGIPPVSFGANQVMEQKVMRSSLPTQLDVGRLISGNEGCSAVPSKLSPHLHGRLPVDLRTNETTKQKRIPSQPDLKKIIIDSDGRAVASPQVTPRTDILKTAHKRKLTNSLKQQHARPNTKGNMAHMGAADGDTQHNVYEEIEDVRSIQSASSSQAAKYPVDYYCTGNEFDDSSEQASSDVSTVFESSPAERKRKLRAPSVKEHRQISILSTRKFCNLGQSPETVLDAIATCFDLTPDEWMVAWNLSRKGVPSDERARILGVRLQEDS